GGSMTKQLSTVIERYDSYEDFIDKMERARLAYQRGRAIFYDGVPDFALTHREKSVRDPNARFGFQAAYKTTELRKLEKSANPMPLQLKAYMVAKQYNPQKRTFSKVIAELAKHKDELHPYVRRYIIERLRNAETHHRKLAGQYGEVADRFESETPPEAE